MSFPVPYAQVLSDKPTFALVTAVDLLWGIWEPVSRNSHVIKDEYVAHTVQHVSMQMFVPRVNLCTSFMLALVPLVSVHDDSTTLRLPLIVLRFLLGTGRDACRLG